jgi:hypothetical protein
VSHAGILRAIGNLPPRTLHTLISTVARGETWLRWPLRTLNLMDGVDDTFRRVDPDGARFGLTPAKLRRFRRNLLYDGIADLAVLLSGIDKPGFRKGQLTVEGADVLERQRESGPGAIVVGFRLACTGGSRWRWRAGIRRGDDRGRQAANPSRANTGEEFAPEANGRIST